MVYGVRTRTRLLVIGGTIWFLLLRFRSRGKISRIFHWILVFVDLRGLDFVIAFGLFLEFVVLTRLLMSCICADDVGAAEIRVVFGVLEGFRIRNGCILIGFCD